LANDIHKIRTWHHDHERHSDEKEQVLIHLIDTKAAKSTSVITWKRSFVGTFKIAGIAS
jgi:hypothetical protein